MSYFELHNDLSPNVIGYRKGSSPARLPDTSNPSFLPFGEFMFTGDTRAYMAGLLPGFNLSLKDLYLDKSAKHTDFISVGALLRGYVVSTKVRHILEQHNLPPHQFYEVSFAQPNKKTNAINEVKGYWWFYFRVDTGESTIDFERSSFDYSVHYRRYPGQKFSIQNFNDYQQIFDETPPAIVATKLVFKPNFDYNLDLWGTRFLSLRNYISERLLKRFEKAKITGYRVKKPDCTLLFD